MGDSKIIQAFPLEIAFVTQALIFLTFKQKLTNNCNNICKHMTLGNQIQTTL